MQLIEMTDEQFAHGKRALEAMRKLIKVEFEPLLRALTRNPKLIVVPSADLSATDGKKVQLLVPWELGETQEHDRLECGNRDEKDNMICPACRTIDDVKANLFHESAHMTKGSFNELDGASRWQVVTTVFKETLDTLTPAELNVLRDKVVHAPRTLDAFSKVDPWLHVTWNCVEDIYVNWSLYEERPGVEPCLQSSTRRAFTEGFRRIGNKPSQDWAKADPHMQAIMVAYVIGHHLDDAEVRAVLSTIPEVAALFDDAELRDLMINQIPAECNIEDRCELAFKLLNKLRSRGFLPRPESSVLPPPPPGPDEPCEDGDPGEGQDGEQEESEGESGEQESENDDESEEGSESTGAGDEESESDDESEEGSESTGASDEESESDDESEEGSESTGASDEESESDDESEEDSESTGSQAAGSNDDESESEPEISDDEIEEMIREILEELESVMGNTQGGDHDEGPSHQQELEQVMVQETFDHPSESVGEFSNDKYEDVFREHRGDPYREYFDPTPIEVPEFVIARPTSHLRVVFKENRKVGLQGSLKSGPRLDTSHLYRAGLDDLRIFGRKNIPAERDWFVIVGLDITGSTNSNGALAPTKQAAMAIGTMLSRLGVSFVMEAHTGLGKYDSNGDRIHVLHHFPIKSENQIWDADARRRLSEMVGQGGNLDGHSMERYRKLADQSNATDKLIMYFTDGEMWGSQEERDLITENVELCRKHRYNLLGIGYRTDSPKQYGLETIEYQGGTDIAAIIAGLDRYLSH